MTLKGTIVGGKNTLAIINDRFVRLRDWIDDYQIVKITKDRVFLQSEHRDIILEILKDPRLLLVDYNDASNDLLAAGDSKEN